MEKEGMLKIFKNEKNREVFISDLNLTIDAIKIQLSKKYINWDVIRMLIDEAHENIEVI